MAITLSSIITLSPIKIRDEKKHFIVEDVNCGEFYEMPEVCIDAIQLIMEGLTLGEVERKIKQKYPKEEVDLIDFAKQLIELQLIAEVDGERIEKTAKEMEKLGFLWISPKVGKFFFNKAALLFYITLFILNLTLLLFHPSLIPHYKDLFISNYMVLNIIAWLVLTFSTVLIHEFGHILAMRAQNLPTKLEVGHRLILIVLETDLSNVWKLPSKDRNVLYLAGLCFDTVMLSIALICQLVFAHTSGIFLSIMSVVVLDIFIRMVYQCCIYMKTDLYFVFENISGCYNLMENAQQMIKSWLPFVESSITDDAIFSGERKTIFSYSIFYFLGVALTIGLYIVFYLPQLFFAVGKVLPGFSKGPTSLPFWDATLFTVQIFLGFLLLLYSWRKKYAQR